MTAILDFQSEQFQLLLIYKSLRYFQYKCIWPIQMRSKFDLGGKKVKCQHRTIILAILVDLLSPIICAKIRTQGLFGYGEEDF